MPSLFIRKRQSLGLNLGEDLEMLKILSSNSTSLTRGVQKLLLRSSELLDNQDLHH